MTNRPTYSARMPLTVGFLALALLVGGIGYWSVRTQIAGAIIANGMIVVENNRQIVQHPEGGIVGEIAARDGDRVDAGMLLVQLDDTLLRSELSVAELQLVELGARRARLEAERDEEETVKFPQIFSITNWWQHGHKSTANACCFTPAERRFKRNWAKSANVSCRPATRSRGQKHSLLPWPFRKNSPARNSRFRKTLLRVV